MLSEAISELGEQNGACWSGGQAEEEPLFNGDTEFGFGLVEDALHCAFKGYHDNFSMFTSSSVMEGDLDQSPVYGDSLSTELHESSSISPGH